MVIQDDFCIFLIPAAVMVVLWCLNIPLSPLYLFHVLIIPRRFSAS